MKVSVYLNGQSYNLDPHAIDIGIPLHFNGLQPNTYGVPKAKSRPYEGQGFIGDVSQGGSCNFDVYQFIPHCNGTHTECVGHLTKEKVYIHEVLEQSIVPATLVSVPLTDLSQENTADTYQPELEFQDIFVGIQPLKKALEAVDKAFLQALVVRTLPNLSDKLQRDYMKGICPFFSNEAMAFIKELGVKHLLVDFPSVDRLFDEGILSNHRIYWDVPLGSDTKPKGENLEKTITEMVYVPNEVKDGAYLLELQIATFMSDASPSRPRLFSLEKNERSGS